MTTLQEPIPSFIERSIKMPDGRVFEIIKPLTEYRCCHDGVPDEARMVFVCEESTPGYPSQEFVLKVKVQVPAQGRLPEQGPSTTTTAELEALEKFRQANTTYAPWLVAFHSKAQDESGPLPGGFINYTVMTKLPGFALFGKYLRMEQRERDEIVPKAIQALRAIHGLGIEPRDRGIRNVMWDPETKHCGIVDFELWEPTDGIFPDAKIEMQRWGLLKPPPARDHYAAFNMLYR